MDKKGMTVSSTDSFFFQLSPNCFKVEHGFAKNMKPGCSYRIAIFKGLQKVDEMSEGIKGKLIGGRIVFQPTLLNFYLPIYTPSRNIQFAVKVFEAKPNEPETEIAVHKIKSGDFIKSFKNEGTCVYREEAQLLENFALVFELFLHTSKIELDQLVKDHQSKSKIEERNRINNNSRTPKKGYVSQRDSQSDLSESGRDGNMFNSKKKLSRKRGHDGRLRSRAGSRENSEISSREGSVRSEKKKLGPFPHTDQNEHFIHSPKKASPPKVEENASPHKSQLPSGKQNLVSVGRKDSNASEIHKPKQPQTPTKPTRIQSNIDRSQSAKKDSYLQRSNILPTETPVATRREAPAKRQQAKSPASNIAKREIHNLQVKSTEKIFQIQQKTSENKSEVFPPRSPINRTNSKMATVEKQQSNVQAEIESALAKTIPVEIAFLGKAQPTSEAKSKDPKTQAATDQKQQAEATVNEPTQKETSQKRAPSAKASLKSKGSNVPLIAVKDRQVLEQQQRGVGELKMKQSMNMKRASSDGQNSPDQQVKKEFQSTRDKLFYVLFFVVSAFLFYNAVTPSRRV